MFCFSQSLLWPPKRTSQQTLSFRYSTARPTPQFALSSFSFYFLLSLFSESSVAAQKDLAADIIIPLDELPPNGLSRERLHASVRLSHRWMARSLRAHLDDPRQQAMYAVVHGGIDQVCDTISRYIYIHVSMYIYLSIYLFYAIWTTRASRRCTQWCTGASTRFVTLYLYICISIYLSKSVSIYLLYIFVTVDARAPRRPAPAGNVRSGARGHRPGL